MTNLAKAIIKPGTICFYGQDPVHHGALLVFVAGERVTAYSSVKAMKLDYAALNLIGPDELAAQAKGILERKDHEDWVSMVAGRLDVLAAGLNLQADKDINLAFRIDQLSGVIKDRLATTATIAMGQPKAPESICCHKCAAGKIVGGFPLSSTRMILCPECRNKRCPRASDHDLACTGSNEPGQPGSVFAIAELPKPPGDAKAMMEAFIADVAKP